jgi:hypothetical protein
MVLDYGRRALVLSLLICCTTVQAQIIPFQFQTQPDCPIALVNSSPTFGAGSDRRQFLTVKNRSAKSTIALIFQQAIWSEGKIDIIALERVSFIMRHGEQTRVSVSVADVLNRIEAAGRSGETIGKPVISVVTVEFLDGELWNAPGDSTGNSAPFFGRIQGLARTSKESI